MRTAFGLVALSVWHGKDPVEGGWGCPIRERWGLSAHQQLSPGLEDKLAYFATVTGSYAAAAKLSAKVGCPVEDSTIQVLVQRLGARAEAQTEARLKNPPLEKSPARAPTPLAVLMVDGFQVRFRGPGWGRQKTMQTRVEWHEAKLGVYYRHEQAVAAERGQLLEKVLVGWQGEGLELGRRLHWEAMRGGLGRAREVLAVADGAPWIWNVVADRWGGVVGRVGAVRPLPWRRRWPTPPPPRCVWWGRCLGSAGGGLALGEMWPWRPAAGAAVAAWELPGRRR